MQLGIRLRLSPRRRQEAIALVRGEWASVHEVRAALLWYAGADLRDDRLSRYTPESLEDVLYMLGVT